MLFPKGDVTLGNQQLGHYPQWSTTQCIASGTRIKPADNIWEKHDSLCVRLRKYYNSY